MLHVFNQVIREFARLRLIALSMGDPVIPKALVPTWAPKYFIEDSAEAYANASRAVFPSVTRRIMCSVHMITVYSINIMIMKNSFL
jgi:hypothetical protein